MMDVVSVAIRTKSSCYCGVVIIFKMCVLQQDA